MDCGPGWPATAAALQQQVAGQKGQRQSAKRLAHPETNTRNDYLMSFQKLAFSLQVMTNNKPRNNNTHTPSCLRVVCEGSLT